MLSTANFQMFVWAEVSLRSLSQLENAEHEKGSLITQRSISIKTVHHFEGPLRKSIDRNTYTNDNLTLLVKTSFLAIFQNLKLSIIRKKKLDFHDKGQNAVNNRMCVFRNEE